MKGIGLDIGTTSISAVVVDADSGQLVDYLTLDNESWLKGESFESLQDPKWILTKALELVDTLTKAYDVVSIGVTGQMHGIVYLDSGGDPTSPLYTWQDGRGKLKTSDGEALADRLSDLTGHGGLSAGYGTVTHYYNVINGLVPKSATVLCTIADFVAMKLAGRQRPLLHPSNAASLGCYNSKGRDFDRAAIETAGMNPEMFPKIGAEYSSLGETDMGAKVCLALGDNQASFLGSVGEMEKSVLVNVGTGGQISLLSRGGVPPNGAIEARPMLEDSFLLVGAVLCAGSAYALLRDFFVQTVEMVTGERPSGVYAAMERLAERIKAEDVPEISTKFRGTREDAAVRGSVLGLTPDNFTPQHFIYGVTQGIADELYGLYKLMEPSIATRPSRLICSGNGVRRNHLLKQALASKFQLPVSIPAHTEEGCYGAALYGFVSARCLKSIAEAQRLISYL